MPPPEIEGDGAAVDSTAAVSNAGLVDEGGGVGSIIGIRLIGRGATACYSQKQKKA
jgi:hypothetical protein